MTQTHVGLTTEIYTHLERLLMSVAMNKANQGQLFEIPADVVLGKGKVDPAITLVVDLKLYWNAKLNHKVTVHVKDKEDEN